MDQRADKYMSRMERKVFTAMSDLAQHKAKLDYITTWGLAEDIDRSYDSVDELPQWIQRKIAVLMIFDPEKPMDEIKGIGRRISRATFWVYPDEGEDDGNDTRTPCEDTGT